MSAATFDDIHKDPAVWNDIDVIINAGDGDAGYTGHAVYIAILPYSFKKQLRTVPYHGVSGDGSSFALNLDANEIRWYEI